MTSAIFNIPAMSFPVICLPTETSKLENQIAPKHLHSKPPTTQYVHMPNSDKPSREHLYQAPSLLKASNFESAETLRIFCSTFQEQPSRDENPSQSDGTRPTSRHSFVGSSGSETNCNQHEADRGPSRCVNSMSRDRQPTSVDNLVAMLVTSELEHFEDLLTSLCAKKPRLSNRNVDLALLDVLLSTAADAAARQLWSNDVINGKLSIGDTPLMRAARARDSDVISLLLLHGADINQPWLQFGGVLDVVLFSPTERFIRDDDFVAVERCLRLLLTVTSTLPVERLQRLQTETGYYPLHIGWRDALREAADIAWACRDNPTRGVISAASDCPSKDCLVPVSPLKHQCRCRIRSLLSSNKSAAMLNKIYELPLPTFLKRYLSLLDILDKSI